MMNTIKPQDCPCRYVDCTKKAMIFLLVQLSPHDEPCGFCREHAFSVYNHALRDTRFTFIEAFDEQQVFYDVQNTGETHVRTL